MTADTRHPKGNAFVEGLLKEVINNKKNYYALDKISTLRSHLKRNNSKIQHTDFGAGSQFKTKEKTVSSFVKSSASDQYKGEILFHLARYFKPKHILELGTNLGLGAAYLASANSKSQVMSLEGCPHLTDVARSILDSAKIKNIKVIYGKFIETLEGTCKELGKVDLAFIDGDHSYQSTIDNYKTIQPFLHAESIVIFDDIYWSDGMLKAWKEIKKQENVVLSLDLYRMGVIFFNPDLQQDELKLMPKRYRVW